MRIISPLDFKAELTISNIDQPSVQSRVNSFIDKYTKKFVKQLFGDTMGNLYIAALNEVPPIEAGNRFYDLSQDDDLKTAITSYVYYWYMRDNVSFSSPQGEKRAKASNSDEADVKSKVRRAWGEMVDIVRNFEVDTELFPEYEKYSWGWFQNRFSYCEPVREIYFELSMF